MSEPLLIEGTNLTKHYGALVALEGADIRLGAGEVRALVGSNGAGKSTLIKLLTGAITPTAGHVKIMGREAKLGDPAEMIRCGVACIYQHSNLVPAMSVLENIFLGRQPLKSLGLVDTRAQRLAAEALLDKHGIDIELDAIVGELPTVKQKEVEILKALALDARIIIMDEPTGWLSAVEVAKLHQTIKALKQRGVGIIYISHMLDEIFAVCDTITIMRDGKVVTEADMDNMDRPKVVQLMVGERLAQESVSATRQIRKPRGNGEVRLSVRDLSKAGVFENVGFDLYSGEILCITGLIGSKRTELVKTLFGADSYDSGSVALSGEEVRFSSPSDAIKAGIGFVPEDRHREGLMLDMSLSENLAMTMLDRLTRGWLLSVAGIAEIAAKAIKSLSIHPPSMHRPISAFSGGNQQKVLIGKWLGRSPDVLILDEPTVGVDVGAKAEIYTILRQERDRGAAVLVVSSDLEEVATIADRVCVMSKGRVTAIHDFEPGIMTEITAEIGGAAA